jgi:chemotaxis protein MotA
VLLKGPAIFAAFLPADSAGLGVFPRSARGTNPAHFFAEPDSRGDESVLRNFTLPGLIVCSLLLAVFFKPEFFDPFSFFFTIGGALAVTSFSYSRQQLCGLWAAVLDLFSDTHESLEKHLAELNRLAGLFRLKGLRGLENQERHIADPYLRHAVGLLVDLHNEETIRARMEHRFAACVATHEINRQILATLGKLLPSFGLIGTLIGMVMLLSRISGRDPSSLPAALGLAVLTTLYGAVAANVLVAPLLARLQSVAVQQEIKMRLTGEWLLMLLRGEVGVIGDPLRRTAITADPGRDMRESVVPASLLLPR